MVGVARTQRESCPLCASGQRRPRLTVFRGGESWHVAICSACGFTYVTDPRADTADHLDGPPADEPAGRPRYRQIARLLSRLLTNGATDPLVVEIGAGRGTLGRLLSRRFQYVGFEPARGLADAARAEGLRIHLELFSPARLGGPADAVVLDNVLEHVLDPVALVREAVAALRPRGYLVVIVPNVADVRRLHPAWRARRHWVPPDHINYFRYRDIARLMSGLGLEVAGFGLSALSWPDDARVVPRAIAEHLGLHPFGLNLYGRLSRADPRIGGRA
jgi:SAM-dependent methyltransferase